jgi:hypothetical protein
MRKVILMMLLAVVISSATAETLRMNPASTADPNRKQAFYGAGLNSCGQYLQDREKDNNKLIGIYGQVYTSWFHGYVSGLNTFASRQVVGQLEQATVVAYFDKWCRDNPLGTVMGAAFCLTEASGGAPLDFTCKP